MNVPVVVVGRGEWGCVEEGEPTDRIPLTHPVKSVCVAYNTDVPRCKTREECAAAMRALQKTHLDMGYSDIFYNFCVGGDGVVYEGRGWHVRHDKVLNFVDCYGSTIVIGIIGDAEFEKCHYEKPYELLVPMMKLIGEGIKLKYIKQGYNIFEDLRAIVPAKGQTVC